MNVRLIATDLDGTLFGTDHLPAPRTVAAVNAARDAGIDVIAVSGRSHFSGAPLAVSTGARLQWFIGSNGGHRLNYESGGLEERLVFGPDVVVELCAHLESSLDDAGFGWELEDRLVWNERFVEMSPTTIEGRKREVSAAGADGLEGIGKLFVAHPEVTTVDLVKLVQSYMNLDVNVSTSGARFVEITPAGADKGSALARLCDLRGIAAADVVAFGDNHNDVTMLEWAGRGIAMGNALDMVKAVADETTQSNDDFGVATVIEALLP